VDSAVDACRFCLRRENLRRTLLIAAIVGTILTAINLGDTIAGGEATSSTWIRAAANYLVPFCVSNAGLLVGRPKR